MNISFRDLKADEIECRVAQVKEKGLSLLLYKNARCDMNILDETVGAEKWQRDHFECKGNLFCKIGIFCDDIGWVWKADCGTESNTEKEKGEASDSFKRAGFNWGIGRELYTAPFIWITPNNFNMKEKNNKKVCYDKFVVSHIKIEDKKIVELVIFNQDKQQEVFAFGVGKQSYKQQTPQNEPQQASESIIKEIESLADKAGVAISKLEKKYKVKVISALNEAQAKKCVEGLKRMIADG